MTNNTNNRSWAQNQTLFSLGTILKMVDDWKEKNPLKQNERYTRAQLQNLESTIIGYCVEEKLGLVYMSYHTLWAVLKHLDPSFTYKYDVIDYTNYNVINTLAASPANDTTFLQKVLDIVKVDGKSINVSYTTTLLPPYSQEIALAITDNKNNAIASPNVDDIEYTKQRAFVKSVAYNTGLGYSCWVNPEGVKKLMHIAQTNLKNGVSANTTSEPVVENKPTKVVSKTGKVANVQTASTPVMPTTPTPTQQVVQQPTQPTPPSATFSTPTASVVVQPIQQPTQQVVQQPIQQVVQQPIQQVVQQPTQPTQNDLISSANVSTQDITPPMEAPQPTRNREELVQMIIAATSQGHFAEVQAYLKANNLTNLKEVDVDGLEKLLAYINSLN